MPELPIKSMKIRSLDFSFRRTFLNGLVTASYLMREKSARISLLSSSLLDTIEVLIGSFLVSLAAMRIEHASRRGMS